MRYFDRAALFVEACLKYGAFEVSEDTDILSKDMCPEWEKVTSVLREIRVVGHQMQKRRRRGGKETRMVCCTAGWLEERHEDCSVKHSYSVICV